MEDLGSPAVGTARRDAVATAVGPLLVVIALVALGIVTPLINATPSQLRWFADTAPSFGWWTARVRGKRAPR